MRFLIPVSPDERLILRAVAGRTGSNKLRWDKI